MRFTITRSAAGLALLAALTAACGGAAKHQQPTPTATVTSPASPAQPASSPASVNPIPQNNGGDHDADNNGGPSDGDGNI
jgi:hypothetical protein